MGLRGDGSRPEDREVDRRHRPDRRRGVCRTDLHIVEGVWRPYTDPAGDKLLPLIMGHENAGWVEAVGKEVEGVKVGDPVIVHPKITGGTCLACRRGFDMHGPGKFPGLDFERWLRPVPLHLGAQHRAAAEDARAQGCRALLGRGLDRVSSSEKSGASAQPRGKLRRDRSGRPRAHRHPVPARHVGGRHHRRRQVGGVARACEKGRGAQTRESGRQRGRGPVE